MFQVRIFKKGKWYSKTIPTEEAVRGWVSSMGRYDKIIIFKDGVRVDLAE
jgi:hypothetical protein